MDFGDAAEDAGADELDGATNGFAGVGLVAHLRLHLGLHGDLGEAARLPDRMGNRLLAVNVFPFPHREHRCVEVVVVGRRDGDGVDAVHGRDHLTVVGEEFRGRKTVEHGVAGLGFFLAAELGIAGVGDVAQCHDLCTAGGDGHGINLALTAAADGTDLDAVIGAARGRGENVEAERGNGGSAEKVAAGGLGASHGKMV